VSGVVLLLASAVASAGAVWVRGLGTTRFRPAADRPGSSGPAEAITHRGAGSIRGARPGPLATWARSVPWLSVRWVRRRWNGIWARVRGRPELPVSELLAALAAELAAGQPLALALESAAAGLSPDPCPHARRAARLGEAVPEGLRRDARAHGAQGLRGLAACWEVAEGSGAGLAQAVGRLAEGHRASAQARAQLEAEVAAVRSSAKLLAALPLFGLAVGHWMGADPLGWLTGSWPGRAVLSLGLLLEVVGLAWLHRIVSSVRMGL
jgi:tight adherence protein B